MGIFHYDYDTGTGIYLSDRDLDLAGSVLGMGFGAIGIVTVLAWVLGAIMLALLSPFFTLFFLDELVEVFVAKNVVFFVGMGVMIAALKLWRRTGASRIVRFLFDAYVVVCVLYVLLYLCHFDRLVYAFLGMCDRHFMADAGFTFADIYSKEALVGAESSGLFGFLSSCGEGVERFVAWMVNTFHNVDTSCFSEGIILEMLKAVGIYVGLFLLTVVSFAVIAVVGIASFAVVTLLPYACAAVLVWVINRLLYRVQVADILASRGAARNEALRDIGRDELDSVLHPKGYVSQSQAFAVYEKVANAGNPVAQACLAQCYHHGEGTLKNEKLAFHWYRVAAKNGHPKGQMMTAIAYFTGDGVKKNRLLAKAWLDAMLTNREYVERQCQKPEVRDVLVLLRKKTRFIGVL